MRSRSYNRFKQFESRSHRSGEAQLDDVPMRQGAVRQGALGARDDLRAIAGSVGALRIDEFNLIDVQQDVAISGSLGNTLESRSILTFAADVTPSVS